MEQVGGARAAVLVQHPVVQVTVLGGELLQVGGELQVQPDPLGDEGGAVLVGDGQ